MAWSAGNVEKPSWIPSITMWALALVTIRNMALSPLSSWRRISLAWLHQEIKEITTEGKRYPKGKSTLSTFNNKDKIKKDK